MKTSGHFWALQFRQQLGLAFLSGTFGTKCCLLGFNDAARVLTKLMRSPIKHWRAQGISVFLHIDDGFQLCKF